MLLRNIGVGVGGGGWGVEVVYRLEHPTVDRDDDGLIPHATVSKLGQFSSHNFVCIFVLKTLI